MDLVPLCVKSQQIPSNSSWFILSHIFVLPLYPAAALTCHCSASMVQEAGGNFWRSDCPPASWGRADGARHSRHLNPPAVHGLLPSIFLSCTWNKVTTDMQEPKGSGSSLVSLQRRFLCDRNQAGEGVAWKGWGDAILGGAQNPTYLHLSSLVWAGSVVGMAWPRCPLELPSNLNYPVVHLNVDLMSKAGFYLWWQSFLLQRCGISILECLFSLFIFIFFYIKPPKRHLPSMQYPHFRLAFCDFGSYFTISISFILAIWKPCSSLEMKHHLLLLVTSYEMEPSPRMNTSASSFMAVAACSSGSLLSQAPCHSFTH